MDLFSILETSHHENKLLTQIEKQLSDNLLRFSETPLVDSTSKFYPRVRECVISLRNSIKKCNFFDVADLNNVMHHVEEFIGLKTYPSFCYIAFFFHNLGSFKINLIRASESQPTSGSQPTSSDDDRKNLEDVCAVLKDAVFQCLLEQEKDCKYCLGILAHYRFR